MKLFPIRALAILAAACIGLFGPVRADDATDAVRNVIHSQDVAVGHDDGATAYSFAAPSIQSQYRTPDLFMWMVRTAFPPVYRHQRFEFGQMRTLPDGNITQEVHIIDADGVAWEALYTLERQPDGSLKINSCVLSKAIGA